MEECFRELLAACLQWLGKRFPGSKVTGYGYLEFPWNGHGRAISVWYMPSSKGNHLTFQLNIPGRSRRHSFRDIQTFIDLVEMEVRDEPAVRVPTRQPRQRRMSERQCRSLLGKDLDWYTNPEDW